MMSTTATTLPAGTIILNFQVIPSLKLSVIASREGNIIYPQGTGDGFVRVRYEGVTNFTIQHGNGEGCNPGFLILGEMDFHQAPLGLADLQSNGPKVESFPNPASGEIHFSFGQISGELQLTNLYGQQVFSETIRNAHYSLDASGLTKGFYLYTYSIGSAITTGNLTIE